MKPKNIPKNWQTWIWFAVIGLTLSYCTAEGCEDCEEPLPTEILSFTYTPNPVFVGDTVTFKVQIKDSLETCFEYYWASGYLSNIGTFINGEIDNSKSGLDPLAPNLNWYKTTQPTNRWVAIEKSRIVIIIFNESRSERQTGTSLTINPLTN